MKLIIFLLLLVFTWDAHAQKIRFTDSRNTWLTSCSSADCLSLERFYYYGTDTFIHGIQYKQLKCTYIYNPSICADFPFRIQNYFVREDTTANKVYYLHLDPFSSPDTIEHILYDYNLSVGDSIGYAVSSVFVDSVIATSTTLINGVNHRVIDMQNKNRWGYGYYTIVEGLGCTAGPLLLTYFGACFEYEEKVVCFSQGTSHPAMVLPCLYLCGPAPSYDTFHNAGSCSIILNANEQPLEKTSLTLYPNPADQQITITTSSHVTGTSVSVYDITGKCIIRTQLKLPTELSISTSSWQNGLYLIVIQNDEGILKKEKLIIQH